MPRPRRAAFALSALAAAVVLTACNGGDQRAADTSTDTARTTRGDIRVALLHPGPTSDNSWNGGAYQGLMQIRDSLGAQVSAIHTKTPAEFEENFREYGAQGY